MAITWAAKPVYSACGRPERNIWPKIAEKVPDLPLISVFTWARHFITSNGQRANAVKNPVNPPNTKGFSSGFETKLCDSNSLSK